jgi:hypothetical protein
VTGLLTAFKKIYDGILITREYLIVRDSSQKKYTQDPHTQRIMMAFNPSRWGTLGCLNENALDQVMKLVRINVVRAICKDGRAVTNARLCCERNAFAREVPGPYCVPCMPCIPCSPSVLYAMYAVCRVCLVPCSVLAFEQERKKIGTLTKSSAAW